MSSREKLLGMAVALLIVLVWAIPRFGTRPPAENSIPSASQSALRTPKAVPPDAIDRENIPPQYWGKALPDLATWRDSGGPEYPPSGKHREKLVRYSLKEDLGIDLPPSATDFHFGGSFRIPLEDFQPFFDAFLDALQINRDTLEPEGPESKRTSFGYPGEPKFRFVRVFRKTEGGMTRHKQLELSKKTLGFSFIHTPNMMRYTFLLDPETGHCQFLRGRFED